MMKTAKCWTTLLLMGASILQTGTLGAAPVVDGTLDAAEYGAALSVQTVQTNFGDNFSELNAGYGKVTGGFLYLMFTGNLENNFNKLMVFIDSKAGGQNAISGTNNPQNFDSRVGEGFGNGWAPYANRGLADSGLQPQQGNFTFDTGFEADYGMLFRRGAGIFDFDFAVMNQTAIPADELINIFGTTETGAAPNLSGNGGNTSGAAYGVGFDNSNTAGITGGTAAADAGAALLVTTGIEIAIPLSSIGNPSGDIKVSAFINGANHDFVSNQFLGGLAAPANNLGSDGNGNFLYADKNLDADLTVDDDYDGDLADGFGGLGPDALGVGLVNLNNFAGNQFFTVPNSPVTGDGDFDNDGDVDGRDFLVWQRGQSPSPLSSSDLALWQGNYGNGPLSALTSVPEPSCLAMLGVTAAACSLIGRRRD
jgi:hypothetical protein